MACGAGELVVDGEFKVDIPRRGRPRKVSRNLVNVDEVPGIFHLANESAIGFSARADGAYRAGDG